LLYGTIAFYVTIFHYSLVSSCCFMFYFFQGARHTYAQVAGRNIANPTAMLLTACDMLDHIQ